MFLAVVSWAVAAAGMIIGGRLLARTWCTTDRSGRHLLGAFLWGAAHIALGGALVWVLLTGSGPPVQSCETTPIHVDGTQLTITACATGHTPPAVTIRYITPDGEEHDFLPEHPVVPLHRQPAPAHSQMQHEATPAVPLPFPT